MRPLTSSEMKSWLVCRRGWWLKYHRGLRKSYDIPSLPNIGNLVHAALEDYYDGSSIPPGTQIAARSLELQGAYPIYAERIRQDAELATIMVDGYVEEMDATGADIGYETVGTEMMSEAQVGPYQLRAKLDRQVRREADGAILQFEHKTVGSLSDIPKYAQGDLQFRTQALLARMNEVRTDGVIINMLRRVKRTVRAKPPFYGRHEVRYNDDELRAHYQHVMAIGREIEMASVRLTNGEDHHSVVPPSISKNHTWGCDCDEVTAMFDDGSDVEKYLAEFWEPYDPMERYAAEEGA